MKIILAILAILCLLLPACSLVESAWMKWYRHQGRERYIEVPIVKIPW